MWALGPVWVAGGRRHAGNGLAAKARETFKKFWCSHDANGFHPRFQAEGGSNVLFLFAAGQPKRMGMGPTSIELLAEIELKSLILAQIERWRHALHMQVERQRGGNPGGERRTGE